MDRGIPTEEVLAEMRQAKPPVSYLVGTPKGRLAKLEQALLGLPWQAVRQGVDIRKIRVRRLTTGGVLLPLDRRYNVDDPEILPFKFGQQVRHRLRRPCLDVMQEKYAFAR